MKKFYIYNGTEQEGPFDISDLKSKNISKQTPIWYQGLSEWELACNIDEFKELFNHTTPPSFKQPSTESQKKKKLTPGNKALQLKKILTGVSILTVMLIFVFMFSKSGGNKNYLMNILRRNLLGIILRLL